MAPMGDSGARGKMIHDKTQKPKISCQTSFKENILVHNVDGAACLYHGLFSYGEYTDAPNSVRMPLNLFGE
jgi:hypothetical protein